MLPSCTLEHGRSVRQRVTRLSCELRKSKRRREQHTEDIKFFCVRAILCTLCLGFLALTLRIGLPRQKAHGHSSQTSARNQVLTTDEAKRRFPLVAAQPLPNPPRNVSATLSVVPNSCTREQLAQSQVPLPTEGALHRVAVLFVGELRSNGHRHLEQLVTQLEGTHTCVGTYPEYLSAAAILCGSDLTRVLTVKRRHVVECCTLRNATQRSLLQFFLLDRLLRHLGRPWLLRHSLIFKARTDVLFQPSFRFAHLSAPGTPDQISIVAQTDWFSYGTPATFLRAFGDFWSTAIIHYMKPPPRGVCAVQGDPRRSPPQTFQSIIVGGCRIGGTSTCPSWWRSP
jgi:hypothetical protein